MSAYGERIARVEEQVKELTDKVNSIDRKLDELLTLKNKGAGAFWLVSLIFGTFIMVGGTEIVKWALGR